MNDETTTPDDATTDPATAPAAADPTPPERLTAPAKPAKAPAKPAKAKKGDPATALAGGDEAEAVALGLPAERTFRVHCPKDRTMPAREVKGLTAADAKERYCESLGIITPGHPLVAAAID
jgi:hypothetical protein